MTLFIVLQINRPNSAVLLRVLEFAASTAAFRVTFIFLLVIWPVENWEEVCKPVDGFDRLEAVSYWRSKQLVILTSSTVLRSTCCPRTGNAIGNSFSEMYLTKSELTMALCCVQLAGSEGLAVLLHNFLLLFISDIILFLFVFLVLLFWLLQHLPYHHFLIIIPRLLGLSFAVFVIFSTKLSLLYVFSSSPSTSSCYLSLTPAFQRLFCRRRSVAFFGSCRQCGQHWEGGTRQPIMSNQATTELTPARQGTDRSLTGASIRCALVG